MTEPEARLKCLELAQVQAKNEGKHQDKNAVVIIAKEFYDFVVSGPSPQGKAKTKQDKAPAIFE